MSGPERFWLWLIVTIALLVLAATHWRVARLEAVAGLPECRPYEAIVDSWDCGPGEPCALTACEGKW